VYLFDAQSLLVRAVSIVRVAGSVDALVGVEASCFVSGCGRLPVCVISVVRGTPALRDLASGVVTAYFDNAVVEATCAGPGVGDDDVEASGDTVRYTTDGSTPAGPSDGDEWPGRVRLFSSTVLTRPWHRGCKCGRA